MRRTEPLPKMYALQYTPPKATWDRVENPRARTTSVSVSCACRQSGPEAKRRQVFSGSDGGLSTGVWTGRFTGLSTTSSTLTLWILSEHAKPQPACCALPLLLYSTQHLHPFTGLNSCGHSPFLMRTSSWMDGLCQELPAYGIYLACAESVSFKADSMEDLAAKKVESGRYRGWIICPLNRCSEDGSSHRYPAFFCGC